MHKMKKIGSLLSALLAAALLLAGLPAASAEGKSNLTVTVSAQKVAVGDTVTVTLSNNDMSVCSFAGGISFDKSLLTCEKIVGMGEDGESKSCYLYDGEDYYRALAFSTTEDTAKNGKVGFAFANAYEGTYKAHTLFVATLRATADGVVNITTYETADGTDTYNDNLSHTVEVTVGTGEQAASSETDASDGDASSEENASDSDRSDETASGTDASETEPAVSDETASAGTSSDGGNDNTKTVLWIALAVLLVAAAVGLIILAKKKKD